MQLGPQRLLGFAFATADLLLEVGVDGRIRFALGASEALSGAPEVELVGRACREFVAPGDRPMLDALFEGLEEGSRGGPVVMTLNGSDASPRAVTLSACRLPINEGAISCVMSRAAPPRPVDGDGLHSRAAFEALSATLVETARATGTELELALVELGGLGRARRSLAPEAAKDLEQRVAGILRAQSHGGGAAAKLGDDRYALVRHRTGEPPDVLAKRMVRLLALDARHEITPAAAALALGGDASAGQVVRAIRYSLDSFIRDGMQGSPPLSLSEAVSRSVRRTVTEVGALTEAVAGKKFHLVYQPVVDLKNGGALHHFEALVRFGDNASPFPLIRMAEELDMIEPLDTAVVERAVDTLAGAPDLSLAVNVSGRTICSGDFIQAVRNLLTRAPQVRGRLLFELTESAAIDDLALADRHLQALRAEGCQVCLDDFGAGAASLAYLQQLSLDLVKIDGRYIRELQHGGRESTFIRHLVHMCSELGVKTLAEMVETSQAEDAVRRAGVDFAQGWLYGSATELPKARNLPPPRGSQRRFARASQGRRGELGLSHLRPNRGIALRCSASLAVGQPHQGSGT